MAIYSTTTEYLLKELTIFCQNYQVTLDDIKHEIIQRSNTLGMTGLKHSKKSKKLISQSLIGNTRSRGCTQPEHANILRSKKLLGRKLTKKHKERISKANKGRKHSADSISKNIETNCKNNPYFEIMSPDGVIHRSNSKRGFCKEHGLYPQKLTCVLKGIYSQHKGWKKPV